MNKLLEKQNGFIAMMSAVIISVILLLIVTTSSFTKFSNRFNIFDSESKERSSALAEACVDNAILELINNPGYLGNATSTVSGSDACYVGPITSSGTQREFKTRAIYLNSHTNIRVVLDTTDFSIVSFEEVPVF